MSWRDSVAAASERIRAVVATAALVAVIGAGARVWANRYLATGFPLLAALELRDQLTYRLPWALLALPLLEACTWAMRALAMGVGSSPAVRPIAAALAPVALRVTDLFGAARRWSARPLPFVLTVSLPIAAYGGAWLVERDLANGKPADERKRQNVLLVTIDTLRADHLGAYGYARPTSPAIDAIARQGVQFWRAATQWPKTSPSLAAMLTSTYPTTNGVTRTHGLELPKRLLTAAEYFRAHGYRTAAVVANVNAGTRFGFDQGFDDYVEAWRVTEGEGSRTEAVTRAGLDLLDSGRDQEPFFLWLHYLDPHAPYDPPARLSANFLGDRLFDGDRRAPLFTRPRLDMGGIPLHAQLGTEDRVDAFVARYDAEIRLVDEQIARLMNALERSGLDERTIVVITADHGESLGDHDYYFDHGRLPFDSCVRVPLVIRVPGGGTRGQIVRSPVELIDVVPTLGDLTGLPASPQFEGKSLRPLLAGERPRGRRWQFALTSSGYARDSQYSLTSERYKLIYVPDAEDQAAMRRPSLQLYDLDTDPGETRNLIDLEPIVAEQMTLELFRRLERTSVAPDITKRPWLTPSLRQELRALGYLGS